MLPVYIDDVDFTLDTRAVSVCDGGDAGTCFAQISIINNEPLAFNYAATPSIFWETFAQNVPY